MVMAPKMITVHCTDTKDGERVSIDAIIKNHAERFGLTDGKPGYHYVIQPDGEKVFTRPLNEVGAHVGGHNTGNVGLCLAGSGRFTTAQFNSLGSLLDTITQTYSIPRWEVHAHNQFDTAIAQGKTCPGFNVNALLGWYLTEEKNPIKPFLLQV